jgi:high affinity Mn2+ porin
MLSTRRRRRPACHKHRIFNRFCVWRGGLSVAALSAEPMRAALAAGFLAACLAAPAPVIADPDPAPPAPASDPAPQTWAVHGQATVIAQGAAGFHAPYQGRNSLQSDANGRETADATLYLGFRPWAGAEVWVDPELDQGFGLSNTLGVAGFPSGEAYKVGAAHPYVKLQRAFLRQTIDLGGAVTAVGPDINQLGGSQTSDRVVLTVGKFSVTDIFDTNPYAHDPRGDFMNWSLIDAGTFDYAANAWGFTYGAAAELYEGRFALRGGVFDLSVVPNDVTLDPSFRQFQLVGEVEADHEIAGQPGSVKLTGFLTRGRMGRFADAIALSEATGQPASTALVRRYRSRPGLSLDAQQQIAEGVGAFLRAGYADGSVEPYEFSDIDGTASGGVSIAGKRWGRPDDTYAIAGVVNQISRIHQQYLADGGLGILVGDGRLPHPGPEEIVETYYAFAALKALKISLDYQFVSNPAYNRDRGPVSIGAIRFHTQF